MAPARVARIVEALEKAKLAGAAPLMTVQLTAITGADVVPPRSLGFDNIEEF